MKLLSKFLLTLTCAATISSCSAMTSEQQEQVNSQLIIAALDGNLPKVQYLVANGADIHARLDEAVRWAAANGHLAVVQWLIEHGANIHGYNDAPLQEAVENRHWAVVEYLVRHGANRTALSEYRFNLLNEYICSELQTALATNNWHRVEELLSAIPIQGLAPDLQDLVRKLLVPAVQEKLNSACLVMPITTIALRTLSFIVGPRTLAAFIHLVKEDTVVGPNMAAN